jgi:hypothetical protein
VVRKVYINYDKAEISTSQEIYGTVAVNGSDRVIPLTLQYYRHGSRSKQIIFADKYIHFSSYSFPTVFIWRAGGPLIVILNDQKWYFIYSPTRKVQFYLMGVKKSMINEVSKDDQ